MAPKRNGKSDMTAPFDQPIFVTRPFLPPLQDFCCGLEEIWRSRCLTNNGPVLHRFIGELGQLLGTTNLCLFANGTTALQIALRGMGISGEVITTPFTFVATAHSLLWNHIRPVFVDIEPEHYTIDPERVAAAVTPRTTAILAVHVYGHPCRLDALADIAARNNLRLIYDAAHAFGVTVGGKSIAQFGDVSMFSFHATKLFHTVEGGMLAFSDAGLQQTFCHFNNHGFRNETEVVLVGTNGKMNELQALMGSRVLAHLDGIIRRRRQIADIYRLALSHLPGIRLVPALAGDVKYNFAYFPIEVDETAFGMNRDALYENLKKWNVYTRRYFFPLVCDFSCYGDIAVEDPLLTARRVANRILTLPLYDSLNRADVEKICEIIASLQR
jgi:dTDP-4-amino-4,6-dideoxygalactose transaminase